MTGSPRNLFLPPMAALAELNIPADLQHATNLTEIAQYGIVATPALVINGKVKSAGRVLNKEQIKSLISSDAEARNVP